MADVDMVAYLVQQAKDNPVAFSASSAAASRNSMKRASKS